MVLKQFIPVIAINVVLRWQIKIFQNRAFRWLYWWCYCYASAYWKWLMRLLIDGDACPDRQKVIELALHYGVSFIVY